MSIWSRIAALALRKSDSGAVGSDIAWGNNWGLSASGVSVTSMSAMQHTAVMACVSVLSEDVAKLPVGVFRRTKGGGKVVATDHELHRLLLRPNAWQTRMEWLEMMQASLVLRRNAYSVILRDDRGIAVGLVPIHPDRVTLYEAPGGEVFYFVARSGLHEMAVLKEQPLRIPAEDVLHVRALSLWSSLLGSSRIGMMQDAIGLGIAQDTHAGRFAAQGTRPSGVLKTAGTLSKEAMERISSDWKRANGGSRNAGGTVILEQGLEWQSMGMTMQDAEFLASRRYSIEDIARGFRVPPHKIGVPNSAPGSSIVQQDQQYINEVISTYCDRWKQKLEWQFGIDGVDTFVEFDYSHFLKADIQTLTNALRAGVLGMIYTPNDARRAMGLPDVDGGDVLYQPTNMAPLGWLPPERDTGAPGSDATGVPAPGGDGDPSAAPTN